MNSKGLALCRMHNLRLMGNGFEAPEDVVRWLGAAQAQEFAPAKWSVGQRTKGVREAAVDEAFSKGSILRTHVLRPTWHFVLPEDIRWMLELTGPRVHLRISSYNRRLGLDDSLFRKCNLLITRALRGGNHLTRKELGLILNRSGVSASGGTLAFIVLQAELSGIVCSGVMQGKQHTYALLEERVPAGQKLTQDEALAELTRRYFTSHGPASVRDTLNDRPMYMGAVVVDGQVEGHWRRRVDKGEIIVDVALYESPDSFRSNALERAAKDYGDFLESNVTLEVALI